MRWQQEMMSDDDQLATRAPSELISRHGAPAHDTGDLPAYLPPNPLISRGQLCPCQGETEKLAIFGPRRGRRGAQLKVMAAVETKVQNYFSADAEKEENDGVDWGTKTLVLKPDELSYALGKKG